MIPFIPHLRMDNTQHDTLYTNIRRNTRHPAKCSEKSYLYQYPSSFVCFCFQHTGSCLALQGCRTAKKAGAAYLAASRPAWDKYPIILWWQAGKGYRFCRLPYPILIPEYILHVRGVNAPCFICSEKCYPCGMAT